MEFFAEKLVLPLKHNIAYPWYLCIPHCIRTWVNQRSHDEKESRYPRFILSLLITTYFCRGFGGSSLCDLLILGTAPSLVRSSRILPTFLSCFVFVYFCPKDIVFKIFRTPIAAVSMEVLGVVDSACTVLQRTTKAAILYPKSPFAPFFASLAIGTGGSIFRSIVEQFEGVAQPIPTEISHPGEALRRSIFVFLLAPFGGNLFEKIYVWLSRNVAPSILEESLTEDQIWIYICFLLALRQIIISTRTHIFNTPLKGYRRLSIHMGLSRTDKDHDKEQDAKFFDWLLIPVINPFWLVEITVTAILEFLRPYEKHLVSFTPVCQIKQPRLIPIESSGGTGSDSYQEALEATQSIRKRK